MLCLDVPAEALPQKDSSSCLLRDPSDMNRTSVVFPLREDGPFLDSVLPRLPRVMRARVLQNVVVVDATMDRFVSRKE